MFMQNSICAEMRKVRCKSVATAITVKVGMLIVSSGRITLWANGGRNRQTQRRFGVFLVLSISPRAIYGFGDFFTTF